MNIPFKKKSLLLQILSFSLLMSGAAATSKPLASVRTQDPFVLRQNGAFSYGYVLTDGSYKYADASASPGAEVSGGYGFRTQDGRVHTIQYTAGP